MSKRIEDHEIVIVQSGRFKGEEFAVEGTITEVCGNPCLPDLWFRYGNFAAKNAMEIDKYTISDAPFYYGKIGMLGFILSAKDTGVSQPPKKGESDVI